MQFFCVKLKSFSALIQLLSSHLHSFYFNRGSWKLLSILFFILLFFCDFTLRCHKNAIIAFNWSLFDFIFIYFFLFLSNNLTNKKKEKKERRSIIKLLIKCFVNYLRLYRVEFVCLYFPAVKSFLLIIIFK